jgi:serine/threonine-protein kinase
MGTVYKAVDETLDREVAIKVLNADIGDSDLLKRFRAEAVTLARLNHPGIATLYELYRDGDELLMVMEFVRGETIHALAERLGALAPPQAAHLAMQVLDALSHAHRAGVVHRDLKPANLMITEIGIVKVMDFGIARVLGTEHFTQGGYMMGTPAYMAPEQVLGGEIDGRSDLYAVGVVLYRLLSGQLPFSADTAMAMVQKQVNDPPIPIARFQPDLPAWCTRVLNRALAKSPADRFQTADEFRLALLSAVQPQALGELPTMATPSLGGFHPGGDPATRELSAPAGVRQGQNASAAAVATPMALAGTTPAPPATAPLPPAPTRSVAGSTTTLVLGRKHLFGLGAVAVVLIMAFAVVGYLAFRRPAISPDRLQIGAVPPAEVPAATPPSTATEAPASTSEQPLAPVLEAPVPPAVTAPAVPVTPGATASRTRTGRSAAGTAAAAPVELAASISPAPEPEPPPPAPPEPEPPAAPPVPTVTFNDVRLLVKSGDRTRELPGILSLGNGQLAVLDRAGGTPLLALPYKSLTGAAFSRSKQPRWKDADGKAIEGKVDLGKLGFFRSERNWVILFSGGEPTFLRLEDGSLRAILPAIESHAGIKLSR